MPSSSGSTTTYTANSRPSMKVVPFNTNHVPRVFIDHKTMAQFHYLVSQVAPNEVQWFSMVNRQIMPGTEQTRYVNGHKYTTQGPETWIYHVHGMMIPKQQVHGAEADSDVRSDPMTMLVIFNELKAKYADDNGNIDMDAVNNDIQRMHVWSHSHPFSKGRPSPSGTDNDNFREWVNENIKQGIDSPMIMLIFGTGSKAEDVYARVYDPRFPSRYFDHVQVLIGPDRDIDTTYMDEAIATKITEAPKSYKKYGGSSYPQWNANRGSGYSSVKKSKDSEADEEAKWEARREKSFELFNKKYNGKIAKNFEEMWDELNHAKDNSAHIYEFWDVMSSYLHNMLEKTVFTWALADTKGDLTDILIDGLEPEMLCDNDDECLITLLETMKTQIFWIEEVKVALTFAKRYANAKTDNARENAVRSYNQNINKILDHYQPSTPGGDDTEELVLDDLVETTTLVAIPGEDDDDIYFGRSL